MTLKDSPIVLDWLRIARKDRGRISHMLDGKDAEAAAFFLQQSLEKYLKAFLLRHGWKLRKMHELDALLDDAVAYNPGLNRFYDLCERVSGYYFAERYPPLVAAAMELTCKDVERDMGQAKKFIKMMFPKEEFHVS